MEQEGVHVIQQSVQYYPGYVQVAPSAPSQQEIVVMPPEEVVFLPTETVPHRQQEQIVIIEPVQPAAPLRVPKVNDDDPSCIYVAAFISIIFPFVGFFTMCCYACGTNLGPRQRKAFHTLIFCIIIGVVIDILLDINIDTIDGKISIFNL